MRAVLYDAFGAEPRVGTVPDPVPSDEGVVVRVRATGLCRSDWHGWQGHDPDIKSFPHVPGHELSGVIESVGPSVRRWSKGDRITVPFVCACGTCPQCLSSNHQVCDHQSQPGFTHWGSFAERVALHHADVNLVRLPGLMEFATAAALGCRFVTAFRAVVDQGRVGPGQWVAVHGCGGVGLSAVLIASALDAKVIAVDVSESALDRARELGASSTIDARDADVVGAIRDLTGGGAHLSIDALGSPGTSFDSIGCLRKRGRHVQVGLLTAEHRNSLVPMDRVVAHELQIVGSHGIQAFRYEAVFELIERRDLRPERLIGRRVSLEEAPSALMAMGEAPSPGITVIEMP